MRLGIVLLVSSLLTLVGCSLSPSLRALLDAGEMMAQRASHAQSPPRLDPRFVYLRFTREKKEAYFVLGYIDSHPDGPVEVWYSSAGEVLRLQDGRVVGSTGGDTDWLDVSFTGRPAWRDVKGPIRFQRTRDVQPGYRFGQRETLLLRPIPAPMESRLRDVPAHALTWFEERVEDGEPLPPARYAVDFTADKPSVIYGEHCLSVAFCFSWQRWPTPQRGAL